MRKSNFSQEVELLLYEVFEELRKNGFSLGISEYKLLLDALSLGYGLQENALDQEKCLQLCKTLWLKPNQSTYIFENIFRDNFRQVLSQKDRQNQEKSEQKNNVDSQPANNQKVDNKSLDKPETKQEEKQEIQSNAQNRTQRIKFELGEAEANKVDLPDKAQKISRKFLFNDYYFEVSPRQMQQICRFLPLTQKSAFEEDIDVEQTIQQTVENGNLLKPAFRKRSQIHNKVHLLIDHEGSMHAFEPLAEAFAQALQQAFAQQANSVEKYYFYNVPQKHLFENTSHTAYTRTAPWIVQLKSERDAVIIISDAGAARNSNSEARFKTTLRFLWQLKKHTKKIVWLNPLPQERWKNNMAERLQELVTMFYLDNVTDLQTAINHLKKK